MSFYKRSLEIIRQGAPLLKISSLPVREEIIRIKTTVPNDRLEMIQAVESHMDEQLSSLERIYRKVEAI